MRCRISFEATKLIGSSQDDGEVKNPRRNNGVWGTRHSE
jgi:hypothetical protein